MERKQAGKVERKTVDVYVRLGTSAWSQSDEDARPPAAIVRLGGCQRNATPAESSPRTARQRQGAADRTATDAPYGPRGWACLTVRQMCGSERTNRKI